MTDHVGDEVASPEIEGGNNGAQGQGEDDVGPAVGPVGEAEDQQRDEARDITV